MWFQDWNYLRVRGEYAEAREKKIGMLELPPRTRRIPGVASWCLAGVGTTSAYAENTSMMAIFSSITRNYLRVRGEYSPNPDPVWLSAELPPRTRRILAHELGVTILMGTTSAYAENTTTTGITPVMVWNYLRVRGEYPGARFDKWRGEELPPRTRRIHDPGFAVGASPGTTSAYAENTLISKKAQVSVRNYLRVRGEYPTTRFRRRGRKELPPRTRRIP